MVDIAQNMSARLEHDLAAANGSFDTAVHGNAFGLYAAIDHRLRGNEKKPAAHVAFDMTVDLDQAVGRNVAFDLQAFCNTVPLRLKNMISPLRDIQNAFLLPLQRLTRVTVQLVSVLPISPPCFSLATLMHLKIIGWKPVKSIALIKIFFKFFVKLFDTV